MNKRTKGALAMVLAESITFSVTNALLGDQSSKRLVEEKALTTSENPKKSDVINQLEKTVVLNEKQSEGYPCIGYPLILFKTLS